MNVITLTRNGPLECHGDLELIAPDGAVRDRLTEAWLCRCGQSAAKPFCDGSHAGAGFSGNAAAPPMIESVEQQEGVLRIRLRANGPLKLEGPLEICDADEIAIWRGTDTALCRCGQSQKKPFCDGTHRQCGFSAP